MDMKVIMAQRAELDEIYGEFAADMNKYLEAMRTKTDDILNIVKELGKSWVSDDYDNFQKSVNKGMATVTGQLERGEKLRQEMLTMKAKIHEALEKFKQKYGE